MKLVGAGAASTIIQWADTSPDRIFHVIADAGTVNVDIQGVTLTKGVTKQVIIKLGPTSPSGGLLATTYYLRRAGGAIAVGPAAAVVLVDPNVTGDASSEGKGGSQRPPVTGEEGASYKLTLTDVIVDGNSAEGDGGGIYTSAAMDATKTIVRNNIGSVNGGGVYNEGQTNLIDSVISGNTAEGGGGLFATGIKPVTISGVTFSGNRAVGGGAISGRSGVTMKIVNSTISGNIGSDVGAGLYTNGSVELNFVTIAKNLAGAESSTAGSGINLFPASTGTNLVTLKNVLLADNRKGWADGLDASAVAALPLANCGVTGNGIPVTSQGNNLSSDTSCNVWLATATDLKEVDPRIGDLADNTGPTFTHALLAGSPALGAGAADATVTVDQRGVTRDAIPDIGAYEVPTPPAPGDGSTTPDDGSTATGGGGGCTMATGDAPVDPVLPALGLLGLLGLALRRARAAARL